MGLPRQAAFWSPLPVTGLSRISFKEDERGGATLTPICASRHKNVRTDPKYVPHDRSGADQRPQRPRSRSAHLFYSRMQHPPAVGKLPSPAKNMYAPKHLALCLRSWGTGMADIPTGKKFWNDVLQKIARRTGRRGESEDLLHEAYLRMTRYSAAHSVEDPSAFLVRTAVNIWIDKCRREKLSDNRMLEVEQLNSAHPPLQDEVIASRNRLSRVKAGLEHLSPRTREIFLMHRLDGLKYSEIADHFGISPSAVEKHVAKAVFFLIGWSEGW
jgi:RNA polymerase sigma-70 factor (ECF subfamily)